METSRKGSYRHSKKVSNDYDDDNAADVEDEDHLEIEKNEECLSNGRSSLKR